jgi:hypothetical protein
MSKRQLKLYFSTELVTKPMIYDLNREYGVTACIQRAGFTDNRGWIVVELEGSERDIDKGLEWMTSSGVVIEPAAARRRDLLGIKREQRSLARSNSDRLQQHLAQYQMRHKDCQNPGDREA